MSRSRNPFDSEFEDDVEAGLLSTKDELEDDVDRESDRQLITYEAPTLTRAQRVVGCVVRFADPTQTVAVGAAMLRNIGLDSPDGFSAVKYLLTSATWIAVKEGMEGVNAMARHEHPFRYHRELGGGSFVKGLVRDIKRKAMVAAPIAAVLVGAGFGRDALFNWSMADPEKRQLIVLAMFYLDGPALRTMMVGLLVMVAYEKGQQLVNFCSPLPSVPVEMNPQTRWYQDVLKGGTRIFYGVMAGEFLREICNTVIGFTYLFQTRMSLMAGPYFDFGLREPAYHYATVPRPFEKLDLACSPPETVVASDDDEELGGEPLRVAPSKCRQTAGFSTRLAIVIMVLGAATVANNFVALKLSGPDEEGKDSFGPSAWSYGGRMAYVSVMMGACTFVYGASMLVPETVQKVSRWCCGLFGRRQPEADVQMNDRVESRRTFEA